VCVFENRHFDFNVSKKIDVVIEMLLEGLSRNEWEAKQGYLIAVTKVNMS
jgi:hypothetical protein